MQKPVIQLVENEAAGVSLLANGGFEVLDKGLPKGWSPYEQGFVLEPASGRNRTVAVAMASLSDNRRLGIRTSLQLERKTLAPLLVRGWSRAENVSGARDSGYSIYVDIVYDDATTLWGKTGNFQCGTHDWEERKFVILPQKPVKSMDVYCLFRGHAGKVWFDDLSVQELGASMNTIVFQGSVATLPTSLKKASGKTLVHATGDGMKIASREGRVTSVKVDGRELAGDAPSGFMARDAAVRSGYYPFINGNCEPLGLRLECKIAGKDGHIAYAGRVIDTTGKDRAINLLYALPVKADKGWQWGDYIRGERAISGKGEYSHTATIGCGSTDTMSVYPVGAIHDSRSGIAMALDWDKPAVCRLAFNAGTRQLLISYDFGLVPETRRFPSAAEFGFIVYRFDPAWGFRAAFDRFMKIFPEKFLVRSKEQGIWMPFTDIAKVQGWQDFGFKYHEGNNNVLFDDSHGILSFRYTEPMTWWMPMPPGLARTPGEAERIRVEIAKAGSPEQKRLASAVASAGMRDDRGGPQVLFRNEPWCNGAIWSLNPNPALPGEWNGANIHWNDAIKTNLYGPQAPGRLDGEYLDSIEGYVTADLNYRRDHFAAAQAPLTFDFETRQPALFKGLEVNEFTRWLSGDIHRLGKLMFANSVPYRFTFLCPWLDVMGTETDWMPGGHFQPSSDEQMSLWRTLSGAKPYLLLMNTPFDKFGPAQVEQYFQRCLFYGMHPSMFSHNASENPYWENPKWYNRDRGLFKKYQPLIKRVAEAGWQPLTGARCGNKNIWIERYGDGGSWYLTLYNDTKETQTGLLSSDPKASRKFPSHVTELVSGARIERKGKSFEVTIAPRCAWVLKIDRTP
jgi:hypothetical protein